MRVARVYKRTQVTMVIIDVPSHAKGNEEDLFEHELSMLLDPAWTTLDDSVRWMEG